MTTNQTPGGERPTFWQALLFWLKLGFISFGGPAGQIAIMHTELVEKKKWISEGRFLHALNFCMLLPGPEAQQLATYIGWLLHRTWGGIVAGVLFVAPSAVILWGLSLVYMTWGMVPWVAGILHGLQAAVVAVVAFAVLRIGKKALKHPSLWVVAGVAFTTIFFFGVNFAVIVAGAALVGAIGARLRPDWFKLSGHGPGREEEPEEPLPSSHQPSWGRLLVSVLIPAFLWWGPILAVGWWLGRQSILFQQGVFFSKAALVTFGGAYAVLPYVAQQAVENYGWLSAPQMMAGLGLAETTPGPLIMVLQFVGFVGAWQHPPEGLSPILAATLGSAITTWATFLPCFLFIFAGAPYLEKIRQIKSLSGALSAITAAVVGVVLNLGLWFGLQTIFPKDHPVDWFSLVVAAGLFAAGQRWKLNIMAMVGCGAVLGWLWQFVSW